MKIVTYSIGCVREYCFEKKFRDDLVLYGHEDSMRVDNADVIVFGTCAGTGGQIRHCIDMINKMLICKSKTCKLVLVGCLADRDIFKNILDRDDVHLIEGSDYLIPLENYLFGLKKEETLEARISNLTDFIYDNPSVAYFSMQNGCLNKCTFCKVHYMEGGVESLPFNESLNYLRCLIRTGTRKIILGGQNLTLYGVDLMGYPILHTFIHELTKEEGLVSLEVNELTIQNMYPELLRELCDNPKVESVSLQLESASDRVLKLMNRSHTLEEYDYTVRILKENGKYVSTILMSGFPTEAYEDLECTIKYLSERGIFCDSICEYDDFSFIPSSKLPQHSKSEKRKHTIYLRERLKENNRLVLLDYMDEVQKPIVSAHKDGKVWISSVADGYSLKNAYKDVPIGTVIEGKPFTLVKGNRPKSDLNYHYKY